MDRDYWGDVSARTRSDGRVELVGREKTDLRFAGPQHSPNNRGRLSGRKLEASAVTAEELRPLVRAGPAGTVSSK